MSKILLPYHSYTHRDPQVASRRLINCYAEQTPTPGKSPIALLRSPGIASWVTLATSPVRGMCVHVGVLYVVAGNVLYSVSAAGTATSIGAIPGDGRVSMASTGYQLIIVAEPDGFIWDGATLTQITDPDFTSRGASQVAVLDSFAIFIEPSSGRFFHSDLLDAAAYDPLNFSTAESYPDNLVACLVDHGELFLFGSDSVELWYNAGTAGSPFAREQNGIIEVGCGAKWTPTKADNTVLWIDDKRVARRLADLTPQRISTHALEQRWAGYSTVEDAYGFAFMHEGHNFWCVTFPTAGETFVYDLATGEWHERRSMNSRGAESHWRPACVAFAYGQNIAGDAESGALGTIGASTYTEFGEVLRMEWTYPNIYAEGRRAFHRRLEIMVQAGRGLASGQGETPEIMLSVSDDGGMTFTPVGSRGTGPLGSYRYRSVWNRLGSSYDRVYRASVSDPVTASVWDTQAEIEGGRL